MIFDPFRHHRHSIRLKQFDYSKSGTYFVTICVKDRQKLFGEIVNNKMELNDAGRIVKNVWDDLSKRFSNLVLDANIVMPNHIHGVVIFVNQEAEPVLPTPTLGDVICVFKSLSAIQVNRAFASTVLLWQRNYYEHIIYGSDEMKKIRQYIADNPLYWDTDEYR